MSALPQQSPDEEKKGEASLHRDARTGAEKKGENRSNVRFTVLLLRALVARARDGATTRLFAAVTCTILVDRDRVICGEEQTARRSHETGFRGFRTRSLLC